jgi:hypothetical protein
MLCVSLNVTRGPLNPLTRREADRDGPDRGELSKLAELPLEFILAPPMSSGLLGTNSELDISLQQLCHDLTEVTQKVKLVRYVTAISRNRPLK